MKKILIIMAAAAVLASCQKEGGLSGGPVEIALCARIMNDDGTTKAPFELKAPTAENPLTAAIWASTTSQRYEGSQHDEPKEGDTEIDYHNSTCFTSDERQLLDHQLFYPANKKTVYFVGFCPKSELGWAVENDPYFNIARYEFDGKTDVMFAKEEKNSIETSSRDVELKFNHVLTWLRFNVVADKEAIAAWGKVKKITIESKKEIHINVSDNTCTFSDTNPAFPTYCTKKGKYTDEEFKNGEIDLSTEAQEVSYTMCEAVNAKGADGEDEYTVYIETEYRPNTSVAINLKAADGQNFSGLTEGRQFTVTLRFKLGDMITTSAHVSEWENGGIGVATIKE